MEEPETKVKLTSSNLLGAVLGAGCLLGVIGFIAFAGLLVLTTNGSALVQVIGGFWPLLVAAAATALIILAVRLQRARRHSRRR